MPPGGAFADGALFPLRKPAIEILRPTLISKGSSICPNTYSAQSGKKRSSVQVCQYFFFFF